MIGTHLMARLGSAYGVDNLQADDDGYSRGDVTAYEELHRIFKRYAPDMVIHAAGEVGRLNGEEYPNRMLETNAIGTLNIVRLCLDHNASLINFSTSEVYGEAFDLVTVKEDFMLNALGTTNIYAASKMFGEAIVKHYVTNYALKACTVRPFMIYGEGERVSKFRSAINNFIALALVDRPLIVHQGTLRAWCHVSDFLDGLQIVMKQPFDGYQAYNIGSEEYVTAAHTAAIVIEETKSKSEIKLVEPPGIFASKIKRASIEKMKALGYSPKVTLRDGIRRVIRWQQNQGGEINEYIG